MITRVKTTKIALIKPYFADGIVIVKNVRIGFDRKTVAASYKRASAIDSAIIIISNAWGKV